jgi:hypothetical protein
MHAQLEKIAAELGEAQERLRRLAAGARDEEWSRRPPTGGWSAAECVAHLNLTSGAFIEPLREALERARALGGGMPGRMRRDLLGWLIWRMSRPGGGMRSSTSPSFVPTADRGREELLVEFERLQREKLEMLRAADGLPIHRVKVASPFDPRASYSVYSALTILPTHQHRHLLQAERAVEALR